MKALSSLFVGFCVVLSPLLAEDAATPPVPAPAAPAAQTRITLADARHVWSVCGLDDVRKTVESGADVSLSGRRRSAGGTASVQSFDATVKEATAMLANAEAHDVFFDWVTEFVEFSKTVKDGKDKVAIRNQFKKLARDYDNLPDF